MCLFAKEFYDIVRLPFGLFSLGVPMAGRWPCRQGDLFAQQGRNYTWPDKKDASLIVLRDRYALVGKLDVDTPLLQAHIRVV